MSSSTQESVCQRFIELRQRVIQLEDSTRAFRQPSDGGLFRKDWQPRWLQIQSRLDDLEELLNRSPTPPAWDTSRPRVLRFPPAEDEVRSMCPF